jgi:hypothetical protein
MALWHGHSGLSVVAALAAQAMGDFLTKTAPDTNITVAIEAEILRIQSLSLDELRALWRDTFRKEVPKALTRDLLVRTLCWHIQERAFGGIESAAKYTKLQPSFCLSLAGLGLSQRLAV